MRSITFQIPGSPSVQITAFENADGTLSFDLSQSGAYVADIRGLFFDLNDPALLGNLLLAGDDITAKKLGKAIDLGKGVNMRGGGRDPYDVGIAFGSPGIGKDDIQTTSFTLASVDGTPLTLDLISNVEFGVRLTSVGSIGGARNASKKYTTVAPAAPDARDDAVITDEDEAVVIDVLANDTDADGDMLTASVVTGPQHGTLSQNPDGTFTYTPNQDYFGSDSFVYAASDGNGGTDHATVSIEITPVNDPPVARPDVFTTPEETTLAGNVLDDNGAGADFDVDGDALVVVPTVGTTANGASFAINADGSFSYTPDTNFNGTDSFTYTLLDGQGGSAVGTVTIDVLPDDLAPVALDDFYAVRQGQTLSVAAAGFLFNDVDPEGGPVSAVALVDNPDNGTLTAFPNGSFTYTPNAGFSGIDSFAYRMRDDDGNFDEATVTINVIENRPPVAADDIYTVRAGETLSVAAAGFLQNDVDPEGGPVSAVALVDNPDNGTLTAFPNGSFTYTPNAGFFGVDSFVYRMRDDDGNFAEATVTIDVLENRPPVALNDAYSVRAGATLSIAAPGFLLNDTDPEGGPVSAVALVDNPDNGTLTAFPSGQFTYTPNAGFSGIDSFVYRMRDDDGNFAEATVTITVVENLPPVALDDNYSVAVNGTLSIAAAGFLSNDVDPEGGPVTAVALVDNPDNGTLTAFPNGSFTYTPNAGFSGIDSFVYRMRDDDGNFDEATVTITVGAGGAPVVALDDNYSVRAGNTLSIAAAGFLLNDFDPEGGPVTAVALVDNPDNGTLTAFPNGSFTYTPNAGFFGIDSFVYRMRDADNNFDEATVTINVIENRPPVALNDAYSVRSGATLSIAAAGFLLNDTDPEGGPVSAVALVDNPDNGTLTAFPNGSFTYTPNAGFSGIDSFVYRIRDDANNFAEATVSITVVENLPPVAADDVYTVRAGETLSVAAAGFLQNDADPEGGPVSAVALVDNPDNGTLTAFPNGSFTYTPNAGFFGVDSFVYRMRDDANNFDEATVTINVIENRPPVAMDDLYAVLQDGVLNVTAAQGFLQNDIDPEGGPVTAVALIDNPDNGALTAFPNGSFTYTPDAGFFGIDSFVYRIRDDDGNFDEATVQIAVISPDQPFVDTLLV